ncbi:sulfurtransferase TusA family protein [Texcoconibacillus texcoconensis]|uniref:Putative OsmC-like protein/TusA-related sulfurtransferase n=1 Tax=Texcoconibacillus texcoconensis TaxID=1095777 RepID=A0A840QPR3_9BACI|nr:OsmC family protein [Texcoconibacillus texcoconensis]MBB5173364.1 putative OsmC-like protein/TusA-related sulfurtransferase [Texcoconibacillus texcoconensis]
MSQFTAHSMCDGGDLDCGSGLLLIIKKSITPLEPGQVLEVRSRERTVADDLPVWCRMVDHEFLGSEPGENTTSYYVQKGGQVVESLDEDLKAAKNYQWVVRTSNDEDLTAKVHSRNHSFTVGQPAEFSEKVEAPSAVDHLLASLSSCLVVGFKSHSSKRNITIDHTEMMLKGKLDNVLYHMELEDTGSPQIIEVTGTFYVTSPNEEEELRDLWKLTIERSPIYQTLKHTIDIKINFSII